MSATITGMNHQHTAQTYLLTCRLQLKDSCFREGFSLNERKDQFVFFVLRFKRNKFRTKKDTLKMKFYGKLFFNGYNASVLQSE
jgi:hypothetical protein